MKHKKKSSRRDFIRTTALGAGLIGTLSSFNLVNKIGEFTAQGNNDLHLKLTGYDYPRIQALYDKKVSIKGCTYDIVYSGGVGDMNTNVFSGPQSFDVTEIGLVPYILAYANHEFRDYTLLPIFPLRMFRHKSVFIHADSGIKKPQDLIGKNAYQLHDELCRVTGEKHDPCVIDVFLAVIDYMEGGAPLPWWNFTAERKNKLNKI